MIVAPASVWASHTFTDVPPDAFYHDDATALRNAGVTLGCTFDGSQYCPDDFVTRGQMAAFLSRLGALTPDKTPVVNADRLDGKDSSEFLTTGDLTGDLGTNFLGKTEKAADADLLDGKDSSEFLGKSEKAADADLLDGKDSSEFLGKSEKAADADRVDGFHADQLTRAAWFQNDYPDSLNITSTDPVLIGDPLSIVAANDCLLLLDGNLDWDDNATNATFDVQWYVNGQPVGPQYSGKHSDGAAANYTLVATAFEVVGSGTYTLELRGSVRPKETDKTPVAAVESLGVFALCVPFDGGGNQVTP